MFYLILTKNFYLENVYKSEGKSMKDETWTLRGVEGWRGVVAISFTVI